MYYNHVKLFFASIIVEVTVLVLFLFTNFRFCSLIFWIFFCLTLVHAIAIAVSYFKLMDGNWADLLDTSLVDIEKISIPMADGWEMVGEILKKKDLQASEPLPTVIVHHGLSSERRRLIHYAVPLALKGYLVLVIDARAHGESAKQGKFKKDDWYISENTGIIPDLNQIVNYLLAKPEVDKKRMALIGSSLGGAVCLTSGVTNEHLKIVIALNPFYSFKDLVNSERSKKIFSEPWFMKNSLKFIISFSKLLKMEEKISPKFYLNKLNQDIIQEKIRLVHCIDDHLVLNEVSAKKIIE
ncbi:MAG: alpha/beta hydrolase, partial [Promethearchaeota archaeon]